jgi:hypothetical protein
MSTSVPLLEALCDLLAESALTPETHAALLRLLVLCMKEQPRSGGGEDDDCKARAGVRCWRRARL